ncbi:major histocompatibility complex class I-related gene protein-like [Thamnophis elegans]|uniref:major histocompatibility complex class I-related gene protein-like n=1 Tax=Thamnophis elegans TaxID=35005 RepID=UPI001377DE91|nr:major histocompatibility complex class I-related gene protein-like [Thamnophis elegans]
MKVLPGLALVLTLVGCSDSRSHTLHYFYTAVWEPNQDTPWFTAVGCLNGHLGGHYNSKTRRAVPLLPWMKKVEEEDPQFWKWNTERARSDELRLWRDMESLKKQYNQSGGLHTWQKMYGCELREDGSKRGYDQYSYDGRDFLSFDKETLTWTAIDREAQLIKRTWEADLDRLRRNKLFLEEICIGLLRKFLGYGKETFARKELPTVKVTRSMDPSGLLETLVCQAFGFYPKEINATWRRDGLIWEEETFWKSIAPNSDGTYHAWLSIRINPKERDRYRCHVEHASLAEPLLVGWKEKTVPFAVGAILGGVLTASLLASVGLVVCIRIQRKKRKTSQTSPEKTVERESVELMAPALSHDTA